MNDYDLVSMRINSKDIVAWDKTDYDSLRSGLEFDHIDEYDLTDEEIQDRYDEIEDQIMEIKAFETRNYEDLLIYFCDNIGASQPKNVCALAVDLAKINGIKTGELFDKYQGDNICNQN